MKKDIHPKVNLETKVTCACGNAFTTISTMPSIHVDICSACHPLFTGTEKLVDTEGRIDKFHKKVKQTTEKKQKQDEIAKNRKSKAVVAKAEAQTSLKDMFKQIKEETVEIEEAPAETKE
jgi:large subunit ribosomal protein L31